MAKKSKKTKTKKPEPKQKEKAKPKRKKGARKKFFEAEIPLTASKVQLYAYAPEDLVGNVVKLDLTKNKGAFQLSLTTPEIKSNQQGPMKNHKLNKVKISTAGTHSMH